MIRDRPFNLKGEGGVRVMVFCFVQNYIFWQHNIFFFQIITLGYMTKTLNQFIFCFLHQNRNIFFSNMGNQNIFLENNHPPPFKLNDRSLRPFTVWKNTCTIVNQVQSSLKTRVQFYVIRHQMKYKKKTRTCNFALPLQTLGPIAYGCYRSLK